MHLGLGLDGRYGPSALACTAGYVRGGSDNLLKEELAWQEESSAAMQQSHYRLQSRSTRHEAFVVDESLRYTCAAIVRKYVAGHPQGVARSGGWVHLQKGSNSMKNMLQSLASERSMQLIPKQHMERYLLQT